MTARQFGPRTVELSNPDKLLFPQSGITKSGVIDYYERIAETMLPFLRDRPMMMHRFPDGIEAEGFYQKQVGDYFPDWIERIEVAKEGGTTVHAICQNTATLVYLANQGCLAFHAWLSRKDELHHPDQLNFDLDPPGDSFSPVRFAARKLKELLDELKVTGYVKTTGSRGLHVAIPLDRSGNFEPARKLARDMAATLAERHPENLTVEQRKDKREGRLYLDTGRNAYAQTAVAPYSLRAIEGAPIATPLDWDEVDDASLDAQKYHIGNIFQRLAQKHDPWADMKRHAVSVEAVASRL